MNRIAKKCLIGSATLHGSLIGIVLICSAFAGRETKPKDNVIEIVPFGGNFTVTDGPSHGGGNPPPTTQAKAEPQPTVAPPPIPKSAPAQEEKPEPKPKKPEPQVEKEKPTVKPTPKDEGFEPVRTKKHVPKVNLTPIARNTTTKTSKNRSKASESDRESERAAENYAKVQKQLARDFASIGEQISRDNSSLITDSIGDGTGGTASVNYRTVIFTRYYQAWLQPEEVDDANATTDARVTIARDGTVISAVVEKRSGSVAMDRSIERALRSVRKLEAFPPAWKESERTFRIRFNLKSLLGIG